MKPEAMAEAMVAEPRYSGRNATRRVLVGARPASLRDALCAASGERVVNAAAAAGGERVVNAAAATAVVDSVWRPPPRHAT